MLSAESDEGKVLAPFFFVSFGSKVARTTFFLLSFLST